MLALRALTPASLIASLTLWVGLTVLAAFGCVTDRSAAAQSGSLDSLSACAGERQAPTAAHAGFSVPQAHAGFSVPQPNDPSSGASLFDAEDQLDDEDDDESGELEAHVLGCAAQVRASACLLGFGRHVVSSRERARGLERPPRA